MEHFSLQWFPSKFTVDETFNWASNKSASTLSSRMGNRKWVTRICCLIVMLSIKFIDHYTSSSSLHALYDVLDIYVCHGSKKKWIKKKKLKGITRHSEGRKKVSSKRANNGKKCIYVWSVNDFNGFEEQVEPNMKTNRKDQMRIETTIPTYFNGNFYDYSLALNFIAN